MAERMTTAQLTQQLANARLLTDQKNAEAASQYRSGKITAAQLATRLERNGNAFTRLQEKTARQVRQNARQGEPTGSRSFSSAPRRTRTGAY